MEHVITPNMLRVSERMTKMSKMSRNDKNVLK